MKKQINPTIKAHLIRGAFYLLLLLAVCAIPFALARDGAKHRVPANSDYAQPSGAVQGQLPSVRTHEAGTLGRGIDATGAAVMKNLLAPMVPGGTTCAPAPWSTAAPGPPARYRAGGCTD